MHNVTFDLRCQRWRDCATGRFVSNNLVAILREVGDDEFGFAAMHLGLGITGRRYRTRTEQLENRRRFRRRRPRRQPRVA